MKALASYRALYPHEIKPPSTTVQEYTMIKPKITSALKAEIDAIIARFNLEELPHEPYAHYLTRYRGSNLYFGHDIGGRFSPICRLTYTGQMDQWEFAIYKYSDNSYDPRDWFFPGAEEVDGTIEGAMRAGLKAYPM